MNQQSVPKSRSRIFIGIAVLMLLLSVLMINTASVQAAATTKISKTIRFNDGSGWYLGYKGKNWYLYNADAKAKTGVQYLALPTNKTFKSGFYMFDSTGKLLNKKAVYKISSQTVHGVHFNGIYYTNSNGSFPASAPGLSYLGGLKCSATKATYKGFYYIEKYGKLGGAEQVRYLSAKKKVNGTTFQAGYYFFTATGKMCTAKDAHKVKQTLPQRSFDGTYYFGDKNGRLLTKVSTITLNKKQYQISATGKMQEASQVKVDSMEALRKNLVSKINSYSGKWAVYVKDLSTGESFTINDSAVIYPASTVKPFVMASTFNQIKKGNISYSTTIKDLLKRMITVSDNECYNELVRRQTSSRSFFSGCSVVNSYCSANGYKRTGVHSTLHPSSSPSMKNGTNSTSVKDCGLLLERIYNGTCVSEKYSNEMLKLLLAQKERYKIPASLPSGTKVASKSGDTRQVEHDMAIVYGPKTNYIVVIFSSTGNSSYAVSRIKTLSKTVYNYFKS